MFASGLTKERLVNQNRAKYFSPFVLFSFNLDPVCDNYKNYNKIIRIINSKTVDPVAVVLFPPIQDISIGDDRSLRDNRSAILLDIRLTCDPESITVRHVCNEPLGPSNDTLEVASRTCPLGLS